MNLNRKTESEQTETPLWRVYLDSDFFRCVGIALIAFAILVGGGLYRYLDAKGKAEIEKAKLIHVPHGTNDHPQE